MNGGYKFTTTFNKNNNSGNVVLNVGVHRDMNLLVGKRAMVNEDNFSTSIPGPVIN